MYDHFTSPSTLYLYVYFVFFLLIFSSSLPLLPSPPPSHPLAQKFYHHFADVVASKGCTEVRELEHLNTLEDLTKSSVAEKFQ